MAIAEDPKAWEHLKRPWARGMGRATAAVAGLSCVGLALLTALYVLIPDTMASKSAFLSPGRWAFLTGISAVGAAVAALVAAHLFRGRKWALYLLLAWGLTVLVAELIAILALLEQARAEPIWWKHVAWVAMAMAVSAAWVVLLVLTSKPQSRVRYGSYVMLSVGAAMALLLVVNVIAGQVTGRLDLRWNVETFGRYGLSASAKRVLDEVDKKVTLTSIYTSTKTDRKGEQYLPRLRDLFREIREYKGGVTAVNVTSDRQKREVLDRLRDRLDKQAEAHREVVKKFHNLVNTQSPQYDQMATQWKRYPPDAWLAQFGLAKGLEETFKSNKADLSRTATDLRAELSAAALPDYPEMVKQIKTTLEKLQDRLTQISGHLRQLESLPQTATKSKASLTKAAAAMTAAVDQIVALAGQPGSPDPKDPSVVLDKLATAALSAAGAADAARAGLDSFNTSTGKYAQFARSWRTDGVPLPQQCARIGESVSNLAEQAQGIRAAAKVEVQTQVIQQIRPALPRLVAEAKRVEAALGRLLDELTKLDEQTRSIFDAAKKTDFLQAQAKPIQDLLAEAGTTGELEDQKELIEQIDEDNIVLVEVGDKVGVVSFDDVWPLAERSRMDPYGQDDDEQERRVFNGDTAIWSEILSMSAEPMGEVVLTFFEDMPPPYMRQYRPGVAGPIPSMYLTALRDRLGKANMEVTEWNLAKDPSPPEAKPGRPRVLVILPPPEPMPMPPNRGQAPPQWGAQHLEQLRKVIDDGTAAVFLACFQESQRFGQMAPPYALNDYLRDSWGVEVRTDLRVVQAEPDPLTPGTYQLPILRWTWLPLSDFTDHPVGKPLKARQLYWLNACPVVKATESKAETTIEEILGVPEGLRGTWASANAAALARKLIGGRGSGIVPGSEAGDMTAPFAVAVEVTQAGAKPAGRIIVLGVGLSFIDPFLNERIPRLRGDATLATDPPPTGDMDLMVNSIYQLIGESEFIGAGPAPAPRIRHIGPGGMAAVKFGVGVLWPLVLLAAGAVVMTIRSR